MQVKWSQNYLLISCLVASFCARGVCQDAQFNKIKRGVQLRSNLVLKNTTFLPWKYNRSEHTIREEYEALNNWRRNVWYKDPESKNPIENKRFIISPALLATKQFRYPELIAFQYNQSDSTYNASTIFLNNFKFFATEGPSSDSVQYFLNFLYKHKVTHLVRLSASHENNIEKCYPYWIGKIEIDKKANQTRLKIALPSTSKSSQLLNVSYHATDNWFDGEGYDPKELLKLILEVKKTTNSTSLIACHCHGGAGRTGTFIAGFILIDEIDRQLAKKIPRHQLNLSVEKIVKQLSLQRFYLVSKPEQYITLYRLVDYYVKKRYY